MKTKQVAGAGVKAAGENGTFEGYASVFGVKDSYGDVVEPGAFTKSLDEWQSKGRRVPVFYGHRTDDPEMCIGHVVEAVEDDHGLKVRCQLDMELPKAAQTHRMLADGRLGEMSFGYVTRDSEQKSDHLLLKDLELLEVSVVPIGANRATSISNVKGGGHAGAHESKGNSMDAVQIKSKSDRDAAMVKVDALAARVKDGEADDAGKAELAALVEAVQEFDAKVSKALESKALLEAVSALGGEPKPADDEGEKTGAALAGRKYMSFTGRKARAAAGTLSKAMLGGVGVKALVASGSSVVGVPLEDQSPIELQRIPTSLLDVLPVKQHSSPKYRYLKQTARDNRAAPWVSGQKPVSSYGVESVDSELTIVAHISDGLPEYDLMDNAELAGFVEAEMLHGLRQAVEAQVLGGTGTGNNLTGILKSAGIVQQAFVDDLVTTTRKAITVLESAGYLSHVFVLRPESWEAISLQRTTGGAFDLGNVAVDRAAQRLHGVPVVVSTALPAGKGVLLDQSAVRVDADTNGVQVKWGAHGDDFGANLIRVRTEGRFGVSVLRPSGVVEIATAADAGE
ncbi:HK97 family phage prohead protease [Gordonia sp. DT219]|uniref:HK97 family phage prohead protease n=1 Tax=Gordonia sp. DT219 TaxID=3416658 RepID=UPI003CF2EE28